MSDILPPLPLTALDPEGRRLPVIDITHPAFRLDDSPQAIAALQTANAAALQKQGRMPRFVMRLMMRLAARKSLLLKALFNPDGDVLPGLTTYVLKLGVENLVSPYDTPIDRRLAASELVVSMRLRLQQTATLLADGLTPDLEARPGAPLDLVNIGGGPAIDSLNALILLKKRAPALLTRPIAIHVLDPDSAGPAFGANALAALAAPGGPLHELGVQLFHVPYDWTDAAPLRKLIETLAGRIVAASSEGALFEYAGDDDVIANLRALKAGGAVLAVGSVTRGDPETRRLLGGGRFALKPRGLERFGDLARTAGFDIVQTRPALISDQVLLRP